MKRYPAYKQEHRLPSIQEVPEHWGVVRNSLIFKEVSETRYGHLDLLSILSDKGIVKQSETGRKERAPEDRSSYKRIQKGDIGYNLMNAFMGSIGVSNYEGIISPAYAVCRPKIKIEPNYFHYLFRTDLYLTEFDRNAYGIMYERNRLYFDNFKKIYVPFPPLDEQKAIARFIDRKLEEIDHFIRNKQRLIELLDEQKTVIINRAVTKGINPHAHLKDSGIEWLGEIPAHWEVVRNSVIFREIVETGYGDLELLSILSDKGIVKQSETGRKERASEDRSSYKRIQQGDIGYNLMNAFMGSIGVSNYEGIISPAYAVCRPKIKIEPNYFHYLFRTNLCLTEFDRNAYGIMYERNRLYFENFKKIYVPFPPLDEQKAIVFFIKSQSAKIDIAIAKAAREIELIQEYRTTLISDAVTGKIDVCPNAAFETTLTA